MAVGAVVFGSARLVTVVASQGIGVDVLAHPRSKARVHSSAWSANQSNSSRTGARRYFCREVDPLSRSQRLASALRPVRNADGCR